MYLLISHENDPVSPWIMHGLPPLLADELIWLTEADFARAGQWELRLGAGVNGARLTLADGRRIESSATRGVVNRLCQAVGPQVAHIRAEDRDYAWQELAAFTLSWLSSFPCPVVNPPAPNSFSGRMRSPLEWDSLARRAGLPLPNRSWSSRPGALSMTGFSAATAASSAAPKTAKSLFVIGAETFCSPEENHEFDPALHEASLALGKLAQMKLLEVVFVRSGNGAWAFHHVHPMPDFRATGYRGLEALRDLLVSSSVQSLSPSHS